MNYPVWDIPFLGAGLVVAIIAIIHVLIAHFAIGGGAFLLVAEWWSGRQPDGQAIRDWLHRFASFFLIYTTVFGAMTGVGIWFSIQLASPEATSLLIHQFVFAWAIEWITFIAELTVLYLYYYGWRRNSRRLQLWLAGLYFVISWFSLFIINGILTFMLTPGEWSLDNQSVLDGFFNPGYFPSLLIRTVVLLLMAGVGGLTVAARIQDGALKERVVRFAARWVMPAAVAAPPLFYWYVRTLPERSVELLTGGVVGVGGGRMEVITFFVVAMVVAGALLVLGNLIYLVRPRALNLPGAVALFLIAQVGFLGGEFAREMARKPYVLYNTLYSNSIWKKDADDPAYRARPLLSLARWDEAVEPLSPDHGEWLFRLQCASCHTREGYRQLKSRTASWTGLSGFHWLEKMDQQGVMPPFVGDDRDRAALSSWLQRLNARPLEAVEILRQAEAERSPAAPPTAADDAGKEVP